MKFHHATASLFISVLIVCSLVCGCTTFVSPHSETASPPTNWREHTQTLNEIKNWHLSGSISIQHNGKATPASFQWQQNQKDYAITLLGPLGIGRVQIDGTPSLITFQQPNKPLLSAKTPERLMQHQLGWYIPISELYYWVRGLPAPNTPHRKLFDSQHQLARLQQAGWEIQYLSYHSVHNILLPQKMVLTQDQLRIKLVIRAWEIDH